MKVALFPAAYRQAVKNLGMCRRDVEVLSMCYHLNQFKPLALVSRFPSLHFQNIYRVIYTLRDAGYVELIRKGTERGFPLVAHLYQITPKGKKFMTDFFAEMEMIAERVEHGY